MKKKTILIIGIVVIALLIGVIGGLMYHRSTYIILGGQSHLRSTTSLKATVSSDGDVQRLTELTQLEQLDLRSAQLTAAQYDTLKAALPECEILWNVPLESGAVSSDTKKLNITTLSDSDIPLLVYFPELTKVNARGCTDYDQLAALTAAYPELDVYYTISLDGQFWPNSTTDLTVDAASPEELANALKYLPNVTSVTLNTAPEDPDVMFQLQETHPGIVFSWQLEVCGVIVDNTATEIDLSGIPMENTRELESKLKYLPNLTKVDMCGCGISNEEMESLNNRHEGILFVWEVQIGFITTRTDATTFMPVREGYRVTTENCYNLRYCTELIALDLGHMKITNCDFVAFMPHLKYLILADTLITDISPLAGREELIFLEIFLTGIKDYSPLVTLTALEDLNIGYTSGDPKLLAQMTWLKRLWWMQGGYAQEYLREKLPNTELAFSGLSSTGNGWRKGQNYYDMRDTFGMGYMSY